MMATPRPAAAWKRVHRERSKVSALLVLASNGSPPPPWTGVVVGLFDRAVEDVLWKFAGSEVKLLKLGAVVVVAKEEVEDVVEGDDNDVEVVDVGGEELVVDELLDEVGEALGGVTVLVDVDDGFDTVWVPTSVTVVCTLGHSATSMLPLSRSPNRLLAGPCTP